MVILLAKGVKRQMKTQQLLEGYEEGHRWAITLEVYPTGGFKAKGRVRQWIDKKPWKSGKGPLRHKDRMWFIYHLGKEYMLKYEVHHEWQNKATCYLLTPKEHRRRDKK